MKLKQIGWVLAAAALAMPGKLYADSARTIYYWDLNGNTAGFGTNPQDGTWDLTTPNWTTSGSGSISTFVWPGDVYPANHPDYARFSGGAGTVTVAGTQTVYGVQIISSGNYNFTGGVIRVQADNATGFGSDQTVAGSSIVNLYSTLMIGVPTNVVATRVAYIQNGYRLTTGTNVMTIAGKLTTESAGSNGTAVWFIRSARGATESFYAPASKIILAETAQIEDGASSWTAVEYGERFYSNNGGQIEIHATNNTYTGETRLVGGSVVLYQSAFNNVAGPLGNTNSYIRFGYGNTTNAAIVALLTGASGLTVERGLQVDNGVAGVSGAANFGVVIGSLHTSGASTFSGNLSVGSSAAYDPVRNERTAPVDLLASGDSTVTFSGQLTSNLNSTNTPVRKIGTGTVILSHANNSYSGGTIVNEGTLLVNGGLTGTGAVTVALGATLGGTGSVTGATTVNGTLSPGMSPGAMVFNSSLSLESGSTTLFEINGTLNEDFDYVGVNGVLTYGGTLQLNIWSGAQVNDSFLLFEFGSQTGTFSAIQLTGDYTGAYDFDYTTGVLTVIPEPGTLGLIGAGLGLAALLRRRRG